MKVLDWFFAARPMLHLPVWTIYLVTLCYVRHTSACAVTINDLVAMLAINLMTASAYFVNQYFDMESDRINQKLGFLQLGLLAPNQMAHGFIMLALISLSLSVLLSAFMFFVLCFLFLMNWMYSASPWRLKDRPYAGLFANAVSFGILVPSASIATSLGYHGIVHGALLLMYFFFAVTTVHLLTTIPDKEGDSRSGKKTVAVVLPLRAVKVLALMSLILSVVVAYGAGYTMLMWISLVSAVPVVFSIGVEGESITLFSAKLPIALLTGLAGWFYPGYFMFVVVLIIVTRLYYRRRFSMNYPSIR